MPTNPRPPAGNAPRPRTGSRIGLLCSLVLGVSGAGGETAAVPGAADARPNIVLVMADDMGWPDPGCFGGEIRTPTLDALASAGLRFTSFHNAGRCCPTRASLLTGLYPHQAGVGHMVSDRGKPGYRGRLSERGVTPAEALRAAGYQTFMSGKWHVTPFDCGDPAPAPT